MNAGLRRAVLVWLTATCCGFVLSSCGGSSQSSGAHTPSAPPAMLNHASMGLDGSHLVLFGGFSNLPDSISEGTWLWSGSSWKVEESATARGWSGTSQSPQAGAYNARTGLLTAVTLPATGLNTWTLDDGVWTPAPSGALAKVRIGGFTFEVEGVVYDLSRQQLLLVSCTPSMSRPSTSIWGYGPSGWAPIVQDQAGPCAQSPVIANAGNGGLLAVAQGKTWYWNGTSWSIDMAGVGPPDVVFASGAYDPAGQEVVFYGGEQSNGVTIGQTWEWKAGGWSQAHPTVSPPAVAFAAMGYDPKAGDLVLEGGLVHPGPGPFIGSNGTWFWNGSNWRKG